jgi:hypothetical protein
MDLDRTFWEVLRGSYARLLVSGKSGTLARLRDTPG